MGDGVVDSGDHAGDKAGIYASDDGDAVQRDEVEAAGAGDEELPGERAATEVGVGDDEYAASSRTTRA